MPSGPTHPPLTVTTVRFMNDIAKKASLWHPGPKPRSSQDERLIVTTKNLMQDQELNLPEHAHCSNIVYSGIPSLVDNHLDPHYMIHEFNEECGPLPTCVLSTLMYQPLGRAGSL